MELPQMRHYTLEEYWQFIDNEPEGRYEYVDGVIRAMSRGTLQHSQIGANVVRELDVALEDLNCCVYNSDGGVLTPTLRVYFPDASVSCDPEDQKGGRAAKYPSVIIEVLSPSTEDIDRFEKLLVYQRMPSVKDILYTSSTCCKVEHFWRDDIRWRRSIYEQAEDVVTLTSNGVQIPLSRIYKKVHLEKAIN